MQGDSRLIVAAMHVAAVKHVDQRRRGAPDEPYVNHVVEVAALLAETTGGEDAVLIAGALLHDTIEDTDTTAEEIEARFGPEVAALVVEVTDDEGLDETVRRRRQIETAPYKSRRAKLLKIADKTSNLRALVASPPDWSAVRKRAYADWAAAVVAHCRGLNAALDAAFDDAYARVLADLPV